jgi:hypothetical protein
MSSSVYSKDGVDFTLLFTLKTARKAGGLQILRCQGIAVGYYGFNLDALTLKPSDFCNVGVSLV